MKKLMIAAAIVCAAAFAQAAATTWSIMAIQDSPDVAVGSGWLVQLFDSGVTYDYDKALAGEITATFTGASAQVGTTTYYKAGTKEGNFSNGQTVSLYAVIYDASTIGGAKNYIVSDVVTSKVPDAGGDITHSFGNMTGTTAAGNKFLNSEWQSVPEPTSGLLLLLGVAGLALRRRRA